MKKAFQNIAVGILVSFIGSLPLGWLNLLAFEIYSNNGINEMFEYLLGIVIIEAVVIFITLKFAEQIAQRTKIVRRIEVFSIAFLLMLGLISLVELQNSDPDFSKYILYAPLAAGLICSVMNLMQIPFWLGWNIYLLGNSYIFRGQKNEILYTISCMFGTIVGMSCFVLLMDSASEYADNAEVPFVKYSIPVIFFLMAVYQFYSYRKKHSPKRQK